MSFIHAISRVTEQDIKKGADNAARSSVLPIKINGEIDLDIQAVFHSALSEVSLTFYKEDVKKSLCDLKNISEKDFIEKVKDCKIYLVRREFHDNHKEMQSGNNLIYVPNYKGNTYDWKDGKIKDEIIDYLGCYVPEKKAIFMWIDQIADACKYKKRDYAALFEFVLLHELTHAYLDVSKRYPDDKFEIFREESLANANALYIAKKENIGDFGELIMYAKSQSAPYKLGLIYYKDKDLLELAMSNWKAAKDGSIVYTKELKDKWYGLVLDELDNRPETPDIAKLNDFEYQLGK